MTQEPWSTDAKWDKPERASVSILTVNEMKIGEVKKIYHPDLSCNGKSSGCTLARHLRKLNYASTKFEFYHSDIYMMVVKRVG